MLIFIRFLTGIKMSINSEHKSFIFKLVLLSFYFVSNTVTAQQQKSYQLLGGVIIDKNIENIYVINPDSGLDSVSLHTGLVNWHSDKAALPVMINNNQLIAQEEINVTGNLSLKSLNTENGEETDSKQLPLPNKMMAPVADGLERKFNIMVNYDNNPKGDILWSYSYQVAQGMVSEDTPLPVKHYGVISLDDSQLLNNVSMRIVQQAHQNTNKTVLGDFLTNLQIDSNARQFKSVDSEHILVSKLKTDPSQWNKYAWDVYDTNGQLVGSLSHSSSYSPFIVSDKTIVFISQPNTKVKNNKLIETPLTLQAISLDSGSLIWDKEVRDLRYNGTYPH